MKDPHNIQLQDKVKNNRRTYIDLLHFEESFYKENSRIKRMKEGDKNTSFFHRTVKVHNTRNKILTFQRDDGMTIEKYSQVQDMVIEFFKNLFSGTS